MPVIVYHAGLQRVDLPRSCTVWPVTTRREAKDVSRLQKGKLLFCVAAGLSFLLSVSLWFSGSREQGLFVGLWVPSILALGALLLAGRESR
jgi:hypothetical protein